MPSPPRAGLFFCLILVPVLCPLETTAGSLSFKNGEPLNGDVLDFDYHQKSIRVTDPVTGKVNHVPSTELSLRSRLRLITSPHFRKFLDGLDYESPGLRRLLGVTFIAFVASFLPGFWVCGWLVSGKLNPLRALVGFFGSWIVITILLICYSFLQFRFEGGTKVLVTGAIVSLAVTPVFVSGVYSCTYGKGLVIFLSHLAAGFLLLLVGASAAGFIAGRERADFWWNETVFAPVGLTGQNAVNPLGDSPETGIPEI